MLLVSAWLFTTLTIAAVTHAIAKAAINKTDARDLPQVLTALAPLLSGTIRSLVRLPGSASATQAPEGQAQDSQQGIGASGEEQ